MPTNKTHWTLTPAITVWLEINYYYLTVIVRAVLYYYRRRRNL